MATEKIASGFETDGHNGLTGAGSVQRPIETS
jgi:hypothetical protein